MTTIVLIRQLMFGNDDKIDPEVIVNLEGMLRKAAAAWGRLLDMIREPCPELTELMRLNDLTDDDEKQEPIVLLRDHAAEHKCMLVESMLENKVCHKCELVFLQTLSDVCPDCGDGLEDCPDASEMFKDQT